MKKLFLLSLLCMFSLTLVSCTNDNAEETHEDIYEEEIVVEDSQEQDKDVSSANVVGYIGGGEERTILG